MFSLKKMLGGRALNKYHCREHSAWLCKYVMNKSLLRSPFEFIFLRLPNFRCHLKFHFAWVLCGSIERVGQYTLEIRVVHFKQLFNLTKDLHASYGDNSPCSIWKTFLLCQEMLKREVSCFSLCVF